MTVLKRPGQHLVLECEECGEEGEEFHTDDFAEMIDAAKRKEWQISNDEGEWHHVCGSCAVTDDGNSLARAQQLLGITSRRRR